MSRKLKSALVFGMVIAVLGLTGYWLRDGGWLQMPRILDVPAVFGGSDTNAEGGKGPGGEGQAPGGEARQQPPQGQGAGQRHEQESGLNWDTLPGVLANLWIIAFIIAAVVYSTKVSGFVFRQTRPWWRAAR